MKPYYPILGFTCSVLWYSGSRCFMLASTGWYFYTFSHRFQPPLYQISKELPSPSDDLETPPSVYPGPISTRKRAITTGSANLPLNPTWRGGHYGPLMFRIAGVQYKWKISPDSAWLSLKFILETFRQKTEHEIRPVDWGGGHFCEI